MIIVENYINKCVNFVYTFIDVRSDMIDKLTLKNHALIRILSNIPQINKHNNNLNLMKY